MEILVKGADEVHVLFNNDHDDFAPNAAERFRRIIGQEVMLSPKAAPLTVARPPSKPAARPRFTRGGQQTLLDLMKHRP